LNHPFTLFEISWEVCNKVGGIYTVLSSKARTACEEFGDDYVCVGPWLLGDGGHEPPFDEEPGFERFADTCRAMGLPVRVGRWRIPGRPRTILIEFTGLYDQKDDVLASLWEDFQVDSIQGGWDYVEPVLFGVAAGRVIEAWWEQHVAPSRHRAVVHAHEWMTATALLHLKRRNPSFGTVFTTHATMLGRALSSLGLSPEDGLGGETAEDLAEAHGVPAKHSLEGVAARAADVFTTVSEITSSEAELLHERAADPLIYNGIDLEVIDTLCGDVSRDDARAALRRVANSFLGEDVGDAALLCVSGRYEFHNKGIDVVLDALAALEADAGRRIVLFILVPAGNSGLRGEVLERLERPLAELDGPDGISTHNLFDEAHDPVHERCAALGLDNAPGSRVKVVQVPVYLPAEPGFLDLPYEAVLRAMDLSLFPSFYEPWGYTPQESLAVGVPTVTSDYAGFGRWVEGAGLGADDGVTLLRRLHREPGEITAELSKVIEDFLVDTRSSDELRERCRETAARTSWSGFFDNYRTAYGAALEAVQARAADGAQMPPRTPRPQVRVPIEDGAPRLLPFDVSATLPAPLRGFERLARNWWWCWDPEASALFRELSPLSWEAAGHDPMGFLRRVYPEDLAQRANDAEFLARLDRVLERFDAYMATAGRALPLHADDADGPALSREHPVAYFCAEYGIHESLRLYSGGLGILAGDHLKSASDLGIPLIAVGLFYQRGYLTQRLTADGEQIAIDLENDAQQLAMELVTREDGEPLEVGVPLPGRELRLRAWRIDVGRVPLYVLDANTPSNRPEDREITKHLYGGDSEMRLKQEIVLGRGGVRLLRELEIEPAAWHMNEGHAAFLSLERVSGLVRGSGLSFDAAREFVRATTAFTTHTPVPAGHDRFGEDLVRRYFSDVSDWVGVPWERFWNLGRPPADEGGDFNMTLLALSFAGFVNGVSKLHGVASRRLLHEFWPGLLVDEVPVQTITNGIHLSSWVRPGLAEALGVDVRGRGGIRGEDYVEHAGGARPGAIWRARQAARRDLLDAVRTTLKRSFVERDDSPILLSRMMDGLQEDALWIGFARRFAPYKRAGLMFQDAERLRRILDDTDRPVRILVAGKAHPRDQLGKDIVRSLVGHARSDDFAGRVFFLENYDIELGRLLVQGVDVWLNNPTRMLEASGTSGMKAAANGALNLSIGDGWWPEAATSENGWTIGDGRSYDDQALQDELDASTLYRLLEEEVVPLFFDRDAGGVPTKWMQRVMSCLETIPAEFNTDRMVSEYLERAYRSRGRAYFTLKDARHAPARALSRERQRVRNGFADVRILSADVADLTDFHVGESVDVRVEVDLGTLAPDDLVVELVLGHSSATDGLANPTAVVLESNLPFEGPHAAFEGSTVMERSGRYAYGIRVRPRSAREPGDSNHDLVLWA
jgi:phosphorylase/glycogen(starch) synthase